MPARQLPPRRTGTRARQAPTRVAPRRHAHRRRERAERGLHKRRPRRRHPAAPNPRHARHRQRRPRYWDRRARHLPGQSDCASLHSPPAFRPRRREPAVPTSRAAGTSSGSRRRPRPNSRRSGCRSAPARCAMRWRGCRGRSEPPPAPAEPAKTRSPRGARPGVRRNRRRIWLESRAVHAERSIRPRTIGGGTTCGSMDSQGRIGPAGS
jgi:hypothetical protein